MTWPIAFLSCRHAHMCLSPRRRPGLESRRLFGLWRGPTNLVRWYKIDGHPLFWDEQNWYPGQFHNPSTHFLTSLTPALSHVKPGTANTTTAPPWAPSRRACPPMGGHTIVERLLGGALSARRRRFILAVAPQPARW
jgi:hypothetical protein